MRPDGVWGAGPRDGLRAACAREDDDQHDGAAFDPHPRILGIELPKTGEKTGSVSPLGQCHQRVVQIVQEIVNRLESHTEPHQVTGHFIARAGGAGMRHPCRMLNEAFDGAEALGQSEDAGPRADLDRTAFPPCTVKLTIPPKARICDWATR